MATRYIRDDQDQLWYYDNDSGRIRCVGSDHEPADEDGYPCDSLEEGRELLIQYGYLSKERGNP